MTTCSPRTTGPASRPSRRDSRRHIPPQSLSAVRLLREVESWAPGANQQPGAARETRFQGEVREASDVQQIGPGCAQGCVAPAEARTGLDRQLATRSFTVPP